MDQVNEAIKFVSTVPQNKWDRGKYNEMYENQLIEAVAKLKAHRTKITEVENKCRKHGMPEDEIQHTVYRSFSHEHIQLLERVLRCKKILALFNMGTLEELTRQKIALLEEMVL
jgi:hypothetical protein